MTKDDIIRMAREAEAWDQIDHDGIAALERFAALVAAHEREAEKQEPVAWDVFELRLYGAPQEKQHRVLWVDRYTHPDGSTPDLDGLLEAATKDGGIDGGAKTLYVRPLYTTPPAAQQASVKLRRGDILRCRACADILDVARGRKAAAIRARGNNA